jgi:simple sugar transport system permease protein
MNETALVIVLVAIVGGALRVSTPFMFVALGECLTEKSGRVNLGLEGTLVLGAMTAYAISYHSGSPWIGVLAAGGAGAVLGAMHGYICKLPRVNDIAVGIAMMLFGTGVAFFFGKAYVQPSAPRLGSFSLGEWTGSQQIATALQINPLLLVGVAVAVIMAWAFANTKWGLIVRMTGDSAPSAKAVGVSVDLVRFLSTTLGGFLAGIGGAFLSLYYPGSWNQGLSSGQGLMAVALVIFARWSPIRCVVAALLFGAAGAIGPALQSVGVTQGYYFFNAAPYILTLFIMVASAGSKQAMRDVPGELSITK